MNVARLPCRDHGRPLGVVNIKSLRTIILPVLAATLALGVAVIGALITGSGSATSGANGFVEALSGDSSSFLGGIRYLSVRGYTLAIVHGLDDASFADLSGRTIELPAALVGVVAVTVGFFLLTAKRLRDMDVQ